jgi:hypothetical protein
MSFDDNTDELRLWLQDFADPEEGPTTFSFARGLEDVDSFAAAIIETSKERGVFIAACLDIADVFGSIDYHEIPSTLEAIRGQWTAVADSLGVFVPEAVVVRRLAAELRRIVEGPDFDSEVVADLVSIFSLEEALRNFEAERATAMELGSDAVFWRKNSLPIRKLLKELTLFKADLRERGELNILDEFNE